MAGSEAFLLAAVDYHKLGWSIVPIVKGEKKPAVDWKKYQSKRALIGVVTDWFSFPCDYGGMAVILGEVSGGLWVRDFDKPGSYEQWMEDYPEYARTMPTVKTARGAHVYGLKPKDSQIKGTIKLTDGELRADGGIVLLPPSLHPSGIVYEWIIPLASGLTEIEPSEIGLVPTGVVAESKRTKAAKIEGRIPNTKRSDTLISMAGSMRARGFSAESIRLALLEENQRCDPPMPIKEVEKIAASGAGYEPRVDVTIESFNCTDLGNAKRFVRQHGHLVRFVPQWRKWIVWDGTRWRLDETGDINRRMKDTVASIYAEAAESAISDERKKIAGWAVRSEAEARIRSAINLAETEQDIPVTPDMLDTSPWLLNCQNGTIELPRKSGDKAKFREHRKEDMITKIAGAAFYSDAACPMWYDFLNQILMEDNDLYTFAQRTLGYGITGVIRDHALFIAHGSGRNGKTTLFETVADVMGEYAIHTSMDTFVSKKNGEQPLTDIARLRGSRLVVASESDQGNKLRESTVKKLTGGDKIVGRFLYQEAFEFDPTFKIVVLCNHKPKITGTDRAIWERVHLIPFNYVVTKDNRVLDLREQLMTESNGILNWLVFGCEMWANEGIGNCLAVSEATGGYREEMDIIKQFIESQCDLTGRVKSADLYRNYQAWAKDNGEFQLTQTAFSLRLKDMGHEKKRNGNGFEWLNLSISGQRTLV